MKGILTKDLMMLRRTIWIYLVIIIAFAGLNGEQGAVFAMFYAIMLPVNMIAMDERSRFERLLPMLPLRRVYCVLDKYIAAWGCLILGAVVGVISGSVRAGAPTISPLILPGMALCLFSQAIALPLILRFGIEQGRMIYLITIVVEAGLLGALGMAVEEQIVVPQQALSVLVFALAAAINAGSIAISQRVYMKRLTA